MEENQTAVSVCTPTCVLTLERKCVRIGSRIREFLESERFSTMSHSGSARGFASSSATEEPLTMSALAPPTTPSHQQQRLLPYRRTSSKYERLLEVRKRFRSNQNQEYQHDNYCEEENAKDHIPLLLALLPHDLICRLISFLDVRSLLQLSLTSRKLHYICQEDQIWKVYCQQLWKHKVYQPDQQEHNHRHLSFQQAYISSIQDAKHRNYIHLHELCYPIVWRFRFKASAGTDWTRMDPYWNYQPCRQMVFFPDGLVMWYNPPDQESSSPRLVAPPWKMTWRFIEQPLDLPSGRPMGSYLRLTLSDRDVPTYAIRRSPTGNWGFLMESCWGLYANFELPLRPKRQPRRLSTGGIAYATDEEWDEGHSFAEQEGSSSSSSSLLLEDPALLITNEMQWREAFLYNVGARSLPEGAQAREEFDQRWGRRVANLDATRAI